MLLETEEHIVSRKQIALPEMTSSQLSSRDQGQAHLPVPPGETTLLTHEDHRLGVNNSSSGSVANPNNLQFMIIVFVIRLTIKLFVF